MSETTKPKQRRVEITPRDEQALSLLADLGLARQSVLHALCYSDLKFDRHVHGKLLRLASVECIGRHFPLIVSHHNTKLPVDLRKHRREVVYFLKKAGAEYIGRMDDYNSNHESMITHNTFNHRLDITDVKACLLLALQASENIELSAWWNEGDTNEEGEIILQMEADLNLLDPKSKKSRKVLLRPDAAFTLRNAHTGAEQFFFLEVDEGTETITPKPAKKGKSQKRGFRDKVLAYKALDKQGIENYFAFNGGGFRVLTINRSQTGVQQLERTNNLIQATVEAGGERQFWFVPFDRVMPSSRPTGESILDSPIWYRCNADELDAGTSLALKDHLF